jgi:hypothetical protein
MTETKRELPDWLSEFVANSQWGEAPVYMYFWTGVSTIAAALRRKVWIDMGNFVWYPNLYTLIVAPPGVVSKSTTADIGMSLLREIPSIHFGPATLTWQALYDAFAEVGEEFPISPTETATQYPLVINSSEFGITLNPRDTEMIDQLVHIWDGREMSKRTRKDGQLIIPTPCLNLIACTTPSWIAENVPQYLIGGGLTSRMLFVYAEEKARFIAYPKAHMPPDWKMRRASLVRDLERISNLTGEFTLTPEALAWGTEWYEHFHKVESKQIDKTLLGGYIARKQTLTHKVAMCLSASLGDDLTITREMLERAVKLITELESQMPAVYGKIGMSENANATLQVLAFLDRYDGKAPFALLYRYMHKHFPIVEDFEKLLLGMIQAGYISINKAERLVIKL